MAAGDINVYGALRAQTAEGKAAYAAQVYDEAQQKFQGAINAGMVSVSGTQSFTDTEKAQARANMGAADADDVAALIPRVRYTTPVEGDFYQMPKLAGQPMLLFCNGAPSAENKPENWIDFLDGGYEWNGSPSAIGQHVLDYTNHVNYYARLNASTMTLEWVY